MWKMEPSEILLNKGGGGGGNNGKAGEGFIDRSKVRILLCDNDTKSSEEVFDLLCKCSYQVTSVRSPRQVIDALNAEGPDIDVILSEVDLPMAKGFKMLKYIMRDKGLRRIPVIMMSAQDEVSLVVKCLRLGAADYLVKPLRTNELLNLWTHMWRRRRMLGLAEKNIMNCEFDLVPSDPSDANTNSTTLFSDDTPEMSLSIHREEESNMILAPGPGDTQLVDLTDDRPNVPEISKQQGGKTMSGPKKSELKIGQSSAFFTYVKSSMFISNNTPEGLISIDETSSLHDREVDSLTINLSQEHNKTDQNNEKAPQHDHRVSDNVYAQGPDYRQAPDPQMQQSEDISGYNAYSAYPYYLSGAMNHVMMQNQYNHVAHYGHHVPGMAPFPYYPVGPGVCLPGQVPPWAGYGGGGGSSSGQMTVRKLDRREAALVKFRQKRKERCFDKKIRYVNRKKLAERRPRVRGQFVRKVNGVNVDLNGQPTSNDFDDEDDDEDDEDIAGRDSSPEDRYAGFR